MTAVMPEPPDRALVGAFDPTGEDVPLTFERDNSDFAGADDDAHWFDPSGDAHTFAEVLAFARRHDRQVVRLYREDDPAITKAQEAAFRSGVAAAGGVTR